MKTIKKVFCSDFDDNYQSELQAYVNTNNELYIEIKQENGDNVFDKQIICLNYETALELIKHLQDEIKLFEKEVANGKKGAK